MIAFLSAHVLGNSQQDNAAAHEKLGIRLYNAGAKYREVSGSYNGVPEKSYAIQGLERLPNGFLWSLLDEYDQDSALIVDDNQQGKLYDRMGTMIMKMGKADVAYFGLDTPADDFTYLGEGMFLTFPYAGGTNENH